MIERILCALLNHRYVVLMTFSPTSRKVGCTRCDKEWGMNDFERAFISWDNDLEEMYKLIGQWPNKKDNK